jgi:hypothetical protein
MTAQQARSLDASTRQDRGCGLKGRRGSVTSRHDCHLVAGCAVIPPRSKGNLLHRPDPADEPKRDDSQKHDPMPRPRAILRICVWRPMPAEDCRHALRAAFPACQAALVAPPRSKRSVLSGGMTGPDPDHMQCPRYGSVDTWVEVLAPVHETGPDQGRGHDGPGMQLAQWSEEPACQGGGRADHGSTTSGEDGTEYVPWGLGDVRGTGLLPHPVISAESALLLPHGPDAQYLPYDLGSERHRPPSGARLAPGGEPGAGDAALHACPGLSGWAVGGPQPMPPPRHSPAPRRVVLTSVPCRTGAQRVSLALCLLARACQEQVPSPIAGTMEEPPPASPECPLPLMEVSP